MCSPAASDVILLGLAGTLSDMTFDKTKVGWDLLDLEAAAERQMARTSDSDDESDDD